MRLQELLQGVVMAGSRAAASGRACTVVQLAYATFVRCDEPSPVNEPPIARVMPNGDVTLFATRPIDPDTIPLPRRPGTLWKPAPLRSAEYAHLTCENCGREYNTHGAPEGTPAEYGLPADTPRHLMCKWSDAEWDTFNRDRRRATVAGFVHDIERDLQKFNADDQRTILYLVGLMSPADVEPSTPHI